jgi:NitT/TauT family transport system ATP-binding protein
MLEGRMDNAFPLLSLQSVDAELVLSGRGHTRILDGISLDVQADELVAVLGPSGSGKSTLAKLCAGLLPAAQGQVQMRGQILRGPTPRVGMVFQTAALFPWLTVQSNIELGLERLPIAPADKAQRVAWAIDRLGLEGYEEAYPREITGGSRLRVAVARALAAQPELLVLDDPFSGLDILTAEAVKNELLDLWQNNDVNPKALLLVTHNIQEAVEMASRVIILGGSPAKVVAELPVPLPYPRDPESPAFQALAQRVHDLLTHQALPDDAHGQPAGRFSQRLAPLPRAEMVQVMGLLEALEKQGGRFDVFDFVAETRNNYGQILMVVNAAEMLGLVATPKDNVELTELGRQVLAADINGKKALVNLQLQGLKLVNDVVDLIHRAPENGIAKDLVMELLALHLPSEHPGHQFHTLISWCRWAELMGYSSRKSLLYLDRLFVREGAEMKELRQPKPALRRGVKPGVAPVPAHEVSPIPEALPEPAAPSEEALRAAEEAAAKAAAKLHEHEQPVREREGK